MTELSNKAETVFVSVCAAAGATATYLASQPIPDNIKIVVCPILGAISVFGLAYWSKKVEAK